MSAVIAAVTRHGLLLLQDKSLPNAVTVITGEHPRGSWWAHSLAQEIFRAVGEAADHEDIITTKLIAGKVTFVHRKWWEPLLAIATSRDPWQLRGLSDDAERLLRTVEKRGEVRVKGTAVKELEERVLVRSDQMHTESGRHETMIETWDRWAARKDVSFSMTAAEARAIFERKFEESASLFPWNRLRRAAGSAAGPPPARRR